MYVGMSYELILCSIVLDHCKWLYIFLKLTHGNNTVGKI